MLKALKKLSFGYLVFGLGFVTGIAFLGIILGMYGFQLDRDAMPAPMAAAAALSSS